MSACILLSIYYLNHSWLFLWVLQSQVGPVDWINKLTSFCGITDTDLFMRGYIKTAGFALKKCPPGAYYDNPIEHDDGQVTYVKNELCFPYFNKYYGCSVCVKVCPFNHQPYEKIKAGF
jgi:hypothetical protein